MEYGGDSGAASTVGAAASARKAVGVAFASTGGGAMIAGSAAAADLRARATPYGLAKNHYAAAAASCCKLRARPAAQRVQGVRRQRHLRARAGAQCVQGVRRRQI